MISDADPDTSFTYDVPSPERRYTVIPRVVHDLTPPSPDQTVAIRKIREVVMLANASIACGGK